MKPLIRCVLKSLRARWRAVWCAFVLCLAPVAAPVSAQIPCLSGFVRDASGNPIADVDLDFIDPVTGVKLTTPNDNTDVTGFYNVCVLPGEYTVTFAPPPGSHFLGKQFGGFNLSTSLELNVELDLGVAVSGTIRDTAGNPVGNVDTDADRLPGGRVFTPDDNSDPVTGRYWLVLSPASYRLRFDPPPGSRLRGQQLDSVLIARDTTIDVTLLEGVLLSGRVSDEAAVAVPNIDVELREPVTGAKIRVSNNTTDSLGRYQVAVPTGYFDLRFVPPRGSAFLGVLYDSVAIGGDRTFDQTLSRGLRVTAFVHDTAGLPIANADFDFTQESTGLKLFTPGDNSDTAGLAMVAVPPGLFTVQIDPPVGSLFDPLEQVGVNLQTDTSLDFQMVEAARVALGGRIIDQAGLGVPLVHIGLRHASDGRTVTMINNLTDSLGYYQVAVPVGQFNVLLAPPQGSRLVGMQIPGATFNVDTTWSPVILGAGHLVRVTVLDAFGRPAEGADLDFISETTATEVYTPFDNADSTGFVSVAIPDDRYTLRVDPPTGSSLLGLTNTGVSIQGDTSFAFVLAASDGTLPENAFVLFQNYPNPFNGATRIPFTLLRENFITVTIVNVLGRHIAELVSGTFPVGAYSTTWDGTTSNGDQVPSGLYFYRIETKDDMAARKLLLLR